SSKSRYPNLLSPRDGLSRLRANNEHLISGNGRRHTAVHRLANARLEGKVSGRGRSEDCCHGLCREWSRRIQARQHWNIVTRQRRRAEGACLRRWAAHDHIEGWHDRQRVHCYSGRLRGYTLSKVRTNAASSPFGRGRRDSLIEAGTPGEGHKSGRILRPHPTLSQRERMRRRLNAYYACKEGRSQLQRNCLEAVRS